MSVRLFPILLPTAILYLVVGLRFALRLLQSRHFSHLPLETRTTYLPGSELSLVALALDLVPILGFVSEKAAGHPLGNPSQLVLVVALFAFHVQTFLVGSTIEARFADAQERPHALRSYSLTFALSAAALFTNGVTVNALVASIR